MTPERQWTIACGERYWPGRADAIHALPLPGLMHQAPSHRFEVLALPDWARELAADGGILVDRSAIALGDGPEWQRCDWLFAAFLHLTCAFERSIETRRGPLHSYSLRLGRHDRRLFDRAWVNRIFLFLRRWSERETQNRFASLPEAQITLTHDLDALEKTLEIRLKQSTFHLINAVRSRSFGKFQEALRFALKPASFDTLEQIKAMEENAGLRSVFHIYGGPPGFRRAWPKRMLLDPGYDAASIAGRLRKLSAGGWRIGLHQSYDAWRDSSLMEREKSRIEEVLGQEITHCRQHWLRFSHQETWSAQAQAGLGLDSTLGFNDRAGFRNGAALRIQPWDQARRAPHAISALAMVFMDSHFYDYRMMSEAERHDAIRHWLCEVREVHGQASVNWHTHTITSAYGWGEGFKTLLSLL